jgi:PD-(D/E)XK nuclease superfamily
VEQNLSSFEKIIIEANKIGLFCEEPKTIFDVLGKKHLERTLADVLAFFCNPGECHPFGGSILKSLLECVPGMREIVEREQITLQNLIPEESTENKKRVDLVFEGDDWVLGVETKINAGMYNDFQQYREHISKKFPKKLFTIIFAPNNAEIKDWPVVKFEKFSCIVSEKLKSISGNSEGLSNSKWLAFLEDFLLNLKNLKRRIEMEEKEADFVFNHYSDIIKIAEMKKYFEKNYMIDTCKRKLSVIKNFDIAKLHGRPKSWGKEGMALIFESEQWGKTQKLIFLLLPNGKYCIQFNVSRDNYAMSEMARKFAEKDWQNGGYHSGDFDTKEKAFTKFQETAEQLTKWKEVCGS